MNLFRTRFAGLRNRGAALRERALRERAHSLRDKYFWRKRGTLRASGS